MHFLSPGEDFKFYDVRLRARARARAYFTKDSWFDGRIGAAAYVFSEFFLFGLGCSVIN